MNALTRFERLDDLFPDMFRRFSRPLSFGADLPSDIRVDISENDKEYLVSAEIPGARKDDIRVSVDGNYVAISAEIRKELEDKHAASGRVISKETCRGSVSRGFTLSQEVDDKATTAKFEDGVLRLTLPKRADSTSRLITVE